MSVFFEYIFNYFLIKSGMRRLGDLGLESHFKGKKTLRIIASSIIRHPVETVRALPLLFRYRKYGHISCSGESMFIRRAAEYVKDGRAELFIFMSYCQKPAGCPAGRFSSDCAFMEGGCGLDCPVRTLSGVKGKFVFLTDDQSVAEVLTRIREDSLKRKKRIFAVFSLCGFAADLALFFSMLNIEGIIMRFDERTSCRGFLQYAYGDMGSKKAVSSLRRRDSAAIQRIIFALKEFI